MLWRFDLHRVQSRAFHIFGKALMMFIHIFFRNVNYAHSTVTVTGAACSWALSQATCPGE
uniref:Uncharacterized protein n=1 Tax=Anguilla anguilla TaxID=7936 RepID=A0A0E9PUN4_ANGAN